jgi:hypothetical protein
MLCRLSREAETAFMSAMLARVARCVSVEASSEGIAFVPSENLGPREGYAPRTDLALLVSRAAGAAALGRALSEAIENCK